MTNFNLNEKLINQQKKFNIRNNELKSLNYQKKLERRQNDNEKNSKIKRMVTFYDFIENGKTGKPKFMYPSAYIGESILDFDFNLRIGLNSDHLKMIKEGDKLVNLKYENLDLDKVKIVVFDYQEDKVNEKNCSNRWKIFGKLKEICNFIKKNYKNIEIFNDINKHDLITDSYVQYNALKNTKFIVTPKFSISNDFLKDNNNYPLIVSNRCQSGGKNKNLFKRKNDIKISDYRGKHDKIFVKFYKSIIPDTDYTISLRLMIVNNILTGYIIRSSNKEWNIHNSDNSWDNYKIIIKTNNYIDNFLYENSKYVKSYLDESYAIFGNGLYHHDVLLTDNKFILCEVGYKAIDNKWLELANSNAKVRNLYKNRIHNDCSKRYEIKDSLKKIFKNLIN